MVCDPKVFFLSLQGLTSRIVEVMKMTRAKDGMVLAKLQH